MEYSIHSHFTDNESIGGDFSLEESLEWKNPFDKQTVEASVFDGIAQLQAIWICCHQ
jgi:hypothetical protein